MKTKDIVIRGARQHNLKNINVELPRNQFIVVTGLSGSGKSTLAFDTLYAEGQRRYVESLSTYARQFLERMEKPDVDLIEGLSPAIAIEQKTASHNPRSTVGTVTEIYDYLRLLYAKIGIAHCPQCSQPISAQTIDQMVDQILALPTGSKIMVMSPVVTEKKGTHEALIHRLRKDGFARIRVNGQIMEIEAFKKLSKNHAHTIEVVVDRLIITAGIQNRLTDSLELALSLSDGLVLLDIIDQQPVLFSEKSACVDCGISFPEFTPKSFSFNSPQGACLHCDGLGTINEFDPELIIPNPELSLRDGAIASWAHRNTVHFIEFLDALAAHYGTDIYTPYKHLPEPLKTALLYGTGSEQIPFYFEREHRRYHYTKPFEGIIPNFKRRLKETTSFQIREEIKQYLSHHPCPECNGTRLNPASRSVTIGGMTINALTALSITQARDFIMDLRLEGTQAMIAQKIIQEIYDRLSFMENVGLSYLTLDRSAGTLSGGENQRIRLATQIGSKLTGVLYVLDEPSIGLHQRDNQRLLQTLHQMRDYGNTVLVVEHDAETIQTADHVIDMGPGAGIHGGEVVFNGSPQELMKESRSLTGQYLCGAKQIAVPTQRRNFENGCIRISGAAAHNLKKIDVEFPLGVFICVTGVSGSGKSTLVLETFYKILAQRLYRSKSRAGQYRSVSGVERIDKVIHIDQSPIGRTPRSNPGTYTGVFSHIRDLYAKTPDSRMRGYKSGRFSFNVKGGRCEACSGDGIIKIEMHFLPDVYVTCDVCRGKRYNRETLEIKYKGKSIADVLDMTVNQSVRFFERIGNIRTKLQTLVDVGLGYIRLGQQATTLSGGEAQRVKLSRELSKKGTGRTIYFLDEPTTGLHFEDIHKLLGVLNRLVDVGNTVVVIEHNLDVIKTADHVIDLGPEGGDDGGEVIGCGTPEQIAEMERSFTGQFLKDILSG